MTVCWAELVYPLLVVLLVYRLLKDGEGGEVGDRDLSSERAVQREGQRSSGKAHLDRAL